MNTEIRYEGSPVVLLLLKNKGVKNPDFKSERKETETLTTVGKQDDSLVCPIMIDFLKIGSTSKENGLPRGTRIYGKCRNGGTPELDSIAPNGTSEEFRRLLLETTRKMLSQIQYPKANLNVGESVYSEIPIEIELMGIKIEMIIGTKYRLDDIYRKIARFSITSEFKMIAQTDDNSFSGSGSGLGTMIYSLRKGYFTYSDMEISMSMQIKVNDIKIKYKETMKNTQTVTIKSTTP